MAAHLPFDARQIVVKATVSAVLTKICALTTRSFSRPVNTNAVVMPRDCDDPTITPGTARIPTSVDSTISGEARFHKELRATIDAIIGVSTVMQFHLPGTGAAGGGYYEGSYVLTSVDISGEDGDHVVASMTFELDDDALPTFTAAA